MSRSPLSSPDRARKRPRTRSPSENVSEDDSHSASSGEADDSQSASLTEDPAQHGPIAGPSSTIPVYTPQTRPKTPAELVSLMDPITATQFYGRPADVEVTIESDSDVEVTIESDPDDDERMQSFSLADATRSDEDEHDDAESSVGDVPHSTWPSSDASAIDEDELEPEAAAPAPQVVVPTTTTSSSSGSAMMTTAEFRQFVADLMTSEVPHTENSQVFVGLHQKNYAALTPRREAPYYAIWAKVLNDCLVDHQYCHKHHTVTLCYCGPQQPLDYKEIKATAESDALYPEEDESVDPRPALPKEKEKKSSRVPDFSQRTGIMIFKNVPGEITEAEFLAAFRSRKLEHHIDILSESFISRPQDPSRTFPFEATRTTLIIENKPRERENGEDATTLEEHDEEFRQIIYQGYHFFRSEAEVNPNLDTIGSILSFGQMYTYYELTREACYTWVKNDDQRKDEGDYMPDSLPDTVQGLRRLQVELALKSMPEPTTDGLAKNLYQRFHGQITHQYLSCGTKLGQETLCSIHRRGQEISSDLWQRHSTCSQNQ
ncbi:hypothetical protein GGG16DRAFT_107849 [Schizophyllum commune]